MPSATIKLFLPHGDPKRLTGSDPETGNPMAYIGEAEVLRDRLKSHKAKVLSKDRPPRPGPPTPEWSEGRGGTEGRGRPGVGRTGSGTAPPDPRPGDPGALGGTDVPRAPRAYDSGGGGSSGAVRRVTLRFKRSSFRTTSHGQYVSVYRPSTTTV